MNLVLKTFTIFLLFLQTCSLATAGDVCQYKGEDLVLHRNYKTGETSCCLNVKCSPGQEAVICDRSDPRSTTCRSCPDGTYQPEATDSADMLHCIAKTQCYGNLSAWHEKSKTKDTRCVCNPKIGTCNPAGITRNPRWCIKKTCAPGFRLTSNCTCEACIKPENKIRQKPTRCDKKDRLCRNKRETSTSETDTSTVCLEDNPESPKVATATEKKETVENPGPILPSSSVPRFSSLIDNRQGNGDVTSDNLSGDVSSDQVDQSVSWYIIFISAVFVAGLVVAVVCFIFVWRHYFHKSDSTSPSGIKNSASAVSNSTDGTEIDGVTIESGESSSLMPKKTSPSSAAPALQFKAGAVTDNGVMRLSDREKLTAQRPVLVQSLVFDEYLWAMLQSNETVTSEMKAQIDKSTASEPERAGALITYLLKRNSHAFATFVAALIYTKQEHLAKALDPGLTAEIKENCEEDHQLMSYVLNLVQSNKDVCMGASQS